MDTQKDWNLDHLSDWTVRYPNRFWEMLEKDGWHAVTTGRRTGRGAACFVMDVDDKVLLVAVHRRAINRVIWEIPRGGITQPEVWKLS